MVPLIDVVLVLLVIFIVTAPLLTNAVKLDLPKATWNADDCLRYAGGRAPCIVLCAAGRSNGVACAPNWGEICLPCLELDRAAR